MKRCPETPPEIQRFIEDLHRVRIGAKTIHARVTERWPDAGVTRWAVERLVMPSAKRHVAKRAKPLKKALEKQKPQPTTCACGQPGLRNGHGWLPYCDECKSSHYGPSLTRGIPELPKLLAFVDAAARAIPDKAEAAFDIKHALRRLDLIERRVQVHGTGNEMAHA